MLKKIASKILNIHPHEWKRVKAAWLIRLTAKIGQIIGSTILISLFVYKMGIENLPFMLIFLGALNIFGSAIYSFFSSKISTELNITISVILGNLILIVARFYSEENPIIFFGLLLASLSIFFHQVTILSYIFTEKMFSPRESERSFPVIESGETIAGIIGGIVIVFMTLIIKIEDIIFVWVILNLLIIPIVIIYNRNHEIPEIIMEPPEKEENHFLKIKKGIKDILKNTFLKGLFFVVLLHWTFTMLIEYQYTKAVDNSLHSPNNAIVQTIEKTAEANKEENHLNEIKNEQYKEKLTEGLGILRILFSFSAIFIQLLLASRIITKIGIIGSLLLHPIIGMLNSGLLLVKFNVLSAVIARTGYEVTTTIHQNAYHSAYYALPHKELTRNKEFLEGFARPVGTILGTAILIAIQWLYTEKNNIEITNLTMFFLMFMMLIILMAMQSKYTDLAKKSLKKENEMEDRLNAIEILSEKGHKRPEIILANALQHKKEEPKIKIKILQALGLLKKNSTIPTILDSIIGNEKIVKLAAIKALCEFKDIGKHFMNQAFSYYRIIEELKRILKEEKSTELKTAIIKLFAILKHINVIPFILKVINTGPMESRASCIKAMQNFKDIGITYYLKKYLNDNNPEIKAAASIVLWKFKKYKKTIIKILNELIQSNKNEDIISAIQIIDSLKLENYSDFLNKEKTSEKAEIKSIIAKVNLRMENSANELAAYVINHNLEKNEIENILRKINSKGRKICDYKIKKICFEKLTQLIEEIQKNKKEKTKLMQLKKYYEILNCEKQANAIQNFLLKTNATNLAQ